MLIRVCFFLSRFRNNLTLNSNSPMSFESSHSLTLSQIYIWFIVLLSLYSCLLCSSINSKIVLFLNGGSFSQITDNSFEPPSSICAYHIFHLRDFLLGLVLMWFWSLYCVKHFDFGNKNDVLCGVYILNKHSIFYPSCWFNFVLLLFPLNIDPGLCCTVVTGLYLLYPHHWFKYVIIMYSYK